MIGMLTDEDVELVDKMDGLFAYDSGCCSSGIKDPLAKEFFKAHSEVSFRIADILIRQYLFQKEYGLEDMKAFIDWFENELGFDL